MCNLRLIFDLVRNNKRLKRLSDAELESLPVEMNWIILVALELSNISHRFPGECSSDNDIQIL